MSATIISFVIPAFNNKKEKSMALNILKELGMIKETWKTKESYAEKLITRKVNPDDYLNIYQDLYQIIKK